MLKLLLNFAASWTWKIYLAIQGIVWSSDVASSGICKQFLLTYWEVVEALISLYEWDVFKYPSLEVIFETCIGYNTWIISSLYSFLCLEVAFCFALFFLANRFYFVREFAFNLILVGLLFLRLWWVRNRTRRVKCSSRIPAKTDRQVMEIQRQMTPATPRGS